MAPPHNNRKRRLWQFNQAANSNNGAVEENSTCMNYSNEGGRRTPPPPGLKGKALGLYYRDRNRKNFHKQEENGFINFNATINVPPALIELVHKDLQKFNESVDDRNISNEFKTHFNALLQMDFDEFLKKSHNSYKEQQEQHQQISNNIKNLGEKYKDELLQKKREHLSYMNHYEERQKLPAMQQHKYILKQIQENQVVLIVGSTGCGKTTQIPQILLDYYLLNNDTGALDPCRIVCTQPRRIAAITVAERVAYERAEKLGDSVGYQIRLECRMPRNEYSILYCTTGIILQRMQTNLLLCDVNVLILDEIHERSIETDLLMGLLKKILPYRPDLKVILMSATVNEQLFCEYFDNCCTVYIEGTLHPVQVIYLEDILQETGYILNKKATKSKFSRGIDNRNGQYEFLLEKFLSAIQCRYDRHVLQSLRCPDADAGCANLQLLEYLIFYICQNKPPGAILVFLPGYDKISKLRNLLLNPTKDRHRELLSDLIIYPLHSLMPTVNQRDVFEPAPRGKRKVILSTSIAETSVTIDDVVYVINSGRSKIGDYDREQNIQLLQENWVSKANNAQRKGRAGRCQPGVCYNLFTTLRESLMIDVPVPEILRQKLESVILNLKLLCIKDTLEFLSTLITPPDRTTITNGVQLLKRIDALDGESGEITPLGVHLAKLPIDPQIGKMVLMSSLFRCIDPITSVAAGISYKTPFMTPLNLEKQVDQMKRKLSHATKSDHLLIHYVLQKYREANDDDLKAFAYNHFLSLSTLFQLKNMKQQFAEILHGSRFSDSSNCLDESCNINSQNVPLLRAIIAAGLYPNIAFLKKAKRVRNRVQAIHSMSTPDGKRVNFHPSSVNCGEASFDSNYFVYFQKQKSSSLYILDATMVYPMALLIFGDGVTTGNTSDKHIPYITLAKKYYFKCDAETAELILQLRSKLELLLQKKVLHPSPIQPDSGDDYLIKAIQILLSLDDDLDLQIDA